MKAANQSKVLKARRKLRIRKKISGTAECPRISVTRSLKHVSVQVIDDTKGMTLVSASSAEKGNHRRGSAVVAHEIGKALAERCLQKDIRRVVFDRNGNIYHGRVKAVAEGAREGGLQF
ncbi:MAG: 50S ribosomal protein L18 [Oligoflexales bacterium]